MSHKRLKLKDIKKDQVFIEVELGMVAKFRALEDAHEVNEGSFKNGYACNAVLIEGNMDSLKEDMVVPFFETYEPGPYGLKLYSDDPYYHA